MDLPPPSLLRGKNSRHLLVVISSHGYGHAMPTAAVLNSLKSLAPNVQLTLATGLPREILAQRIESEFSLIEHSVEFGMRMASPLDIHSEESAEGYADLVQRWDELVNGEAALIDELDPDLVLSNISFLAIAGARQAGRRSAAMCSFTWADVFESYCGYRRDADEISSRLWSTYNDAEVFLHADPGTPMARLTNLRPIGPIGTPGVDRSREIRSQLDLNAHRRLVVSDLGGILRGAKSIELPQISGVHWLVADEPTPGRTDVSRISQLGLSHVDAIASADAVVTKPGYGTFIEACCSATRTLYVERGTWPEEPHLVPWLHRHGCAASIDRKTWEAGAYADELLELFERPVPTPPKPTGNEEAANALIEMMS